MFKRSFAIVVTLLSICLSNAVHAQECMHTALEDEAWLKSQPAEPISGLEDQALVSQNVLGHLKTKTCKGAEVAQLITDLQDARVRVVDGSICSENGQERVVVLFSHWQTSTFYCDEK